MTNRAENPSRAYGTYAGSDSGRISARIRIVITG